MKVALKLKSKRVHVLFYSENPIPQFVCLNICLKDIRAFAEVTGIHF